MKIIAIRCENCAPFNPNGCNCDTDGDYILRNGVTLVDSDGKEHFVPVPFQVSVNIGNANPSVMVGPYVVYLSDTAYNTIQELANAICACGNPASGGGGGSADNWGTQVAVTNATLTGDGTTGNPLSIAQQGATAGQALIWNGTTWVPQIPAGDNWGTDVVNHNATLSGNGTLANPLTIAQQGATAGQTLTWNGTTWVPQTPVGDNWGTQSAVTDMTLAGNGLPGTPLTINQQGATTGQTLVWNGTTWVPGTPPPPNYPYHDDDVAARVAGLQDNDIYRVSGNGPYGITRGFLRQLEPGGINS